MTNLIKKILSRAEEAGKRIQDKRDNRDTPHDKILHPDRFDDDDNRTKNHPKFGTPPSPDSSLKIKPKEEPRFGASHNKSFTDK